MIRSPSKRVRTPVRIGPGLVARGGEGDLGQGPPQDLLADPGRRPLAGRRNRGELVGVDPAEVGLEAAAAEVEPVAVAELQVDALVRERVDDVREEPRRDRDRSVGLDLAGNPVGDPDLEVRRRELQPGVLGAEQDVGEHRQRAPARHRVADDREAAGEVLLDDRQVHGRVTPGERGGRRRRVGRAGPAGGLMVGLIFARTSSPYSSWRGHGGRASAAVRAASRGGPPPAGGQCCCRPGATGDRRWTSLPSARPWRHGARRPVVDRRAQRRLSDTAQRGADAPVPRRPRRAVALSRRRSARGQPRCRGAARR